MKSQRTSVWLRWLNAREVPPAHIAVVLGMPEDLVVKTLARLAAHWISPADLARMRALRADGKTLAEIGQALGRHRGTVGGALKRGDRCVAIAPRRSRIFGPTAAKVRALNDLHYQPTPIARLCNVAVSDVHDFIARLRGTRTTRLVRPRTRAEQDALKPKRRRPPVKPTPPVIDPADAWRWQDDTPDPSAPASCPILGNSSLELDSALVDRELPAAPPSVANPWVGPATVRAIGEAHGSARLTEAKVRDILCEYRKGRSIRALAREHSVNQGTIRAVVRGVTWSHVARPVPSPAVAEGLPSE